MEWLTAIVLLFITLIVVKKSCRPIAVSSFNSKKICKDLILQDAKIAGLVVLLSYTYTRKNQRLVLRIRQSVRDKFPHASVKEINLITYQLLVCSINISMNRNKK